MAGSSTDLPPAAERAWMTDAEKEEYNRQLDSRDARWEAWEAERKQGLLHRLHFPEDEVILRRWKAKPLLLQASMTRANVDFEWDPEVRRQKGLQLKRVKPKDLQRLDKPLQQHVGEHYETWLARDSGRISKRARLAQVQQLEAPHTPELMEPSARVPRTTIPRTPSPESSPFEIWLPNRD